MPSIRRSHLLIGLAVVVAAVGLFFLVRALSGDEEPIAAPSPSASPSPSPEPAEAKAFTVTLLKARGRALDSTNMYGRTPEPRPTVVKAAAASAIKVLEAYLDQEFVAPKTRFTAAPLRLLLTGEARKQLAPADRAALGVSKLSKVKMVGGGKGKASVRAMVLHEGDDAHSVTLTYRATIPLIFDVKPQPLVQEGTMVFALTGAGWRADMIDVRLSLPTPPKEPKTPPSEDATTTPAPPSEEGTS